MGAVALPKMDKFRFAVEKDGAGCSNMWFAEQKGRDLYLSARAANNTVKVSLHGTGVCHIKGRGPRGEETLSRWYRAPTPDVGAVHALSVVFPTDLTHNWRPLEKLKQNKVAVTLPAAPAGHAIEFQFSFTRELPAVFEPRILLPDFPVVFFDLPSGEYIWVSARCVTFGSAQIPTGVQKATGTLSMPPSGELKNVAMIGWTEPRDGAPVWVTNIQGITIRRGP